MNTVDVGESLTYGFKLFVYLLGIAVVGGGGMALGGALAGPEIIDGTVTDNLSSPELLGGAVLGILGLTVWLSGSLGLTYKLLADAVQRGTPAATDLTADSQETNQKPTVQRPPEPVGPSPGEQAARQFGRGSTVPSAANVPDRARHPVAESDSGTAQTTEKQPVDTTTQPPEPAVETESPDETGVTEDNSPTKPESTPNEPPTDGDDSTTEQQPATDVTESMAADSTDSAVAEDSPSQTTKRESDDASASPGDPKLFDESEEAPEERPDTAETEDTTGETDDASTERTAEEIAFGTGEKPASEVPATQEAGPDSADQSTPEHADDNERDTPTETGSIPPYEEMDESELAESSEHESIRQETDSTQGANSKTEDESDAENGSVDSDTLLSPSHSEDDQTETPKPEVGDDADETDEHAEDTNSDDADDNSDTGMDPLS
ncbi:hypothetical protein ACFQJ7_14175 [Halovenus rubra]|uniref:Uncharacterized protein n=2 Tax=Halovenus rubra TaxID=869890 RepID=A0ACC7DYW6_9EURY|nr:hypothetical protein [Halovenus rubra]